MKKLYTISLSLLLTLNIIAQTIEVSDNLELIQLSENCYIHTCNHNNGMVFINEDKALVVSTPDSDIETQNLIDWLSKEKKLDIVAYVIDRWHPDAMEGLDVVYENGIPSFAYDLTCHIASGNKLPVPQNAFTDSLQINIGDKIAICYYFGPAHTPDGIVVWIPSEEILFAGNGIRNYNGWVGNIADADLTEWSNTAQKIKDRFPNAKYVIPGHGKHGGTELIDYTIKLYDIPAMELTEEYENITPYPVFKENQEFIIKAEKDTIINSKRELYNAQVIICDDNLYALIIADTITLNEDKLRLDSPSGRLLLYYKAPFERSLVTNINYKTLILIKEYDEVGLRVIVKEFQPDS